MKHLETGGMLWCGTEEYFDITDDPRDANCPACLKTAASYGAAAAMRYAAVEAGATRDPELVRERDEAIQRLSDINQAITKQGGFFCTDCRRIRALSDRGLAAGGLVWCVDCAPHNHVPS